MPTKSRRKRVTKNPDDRRDDILRAGERVFSTTGFERATISELADAAEIGKGTFYLYFESKDHLLGAMWEQYVDAIVSTAQEILAESAGWWPTIDRVMSALIGLALKNAELHRIVYGSANAKALELCRRANQRAIDLMCDFVEEGTQVGAFDALDTRQAFRMAYHAADGLLDDLIAQGDTIDASRVTAMVLELMHRGLGDARYVAHPQQA